MGLNNSHLLDGKRTDLGKEGKELMQLGAKGQVDEGAEAIAVRREVIGSITHRDRERRKEGWQTETSTTGCTSDQKKKIVHPNLTYLLYKSKF